MALLRSAATVGLLTLMSRVLGFVRDMLTAAFLGAGPVTDAFFVAQRLPNLFRSLFAEGAFNVAFVPLGTPLLAGPGAIVATMLFVQRVNSVGGGIAFGAAIVAVVVALWLAMRFSGVILRLLRDSGVELLTRIAGLLLSAIAVQLIVGAVRTLIRMGLG